ncbi:MAG: flagellar basal body P-ring protein FlgI [Armatimonadetes bacterium]|nr:flagellar basal body P-ring protein FlgI [Armatimonadota bacterium]
MRHLALATILVLALSATVNTAGASSRIKDIAVLAGMGRHKLLGYGLVVGLEGTGDSDSSLLTARSTANVLESFGVTVASEDLTAKNVAAVMVTAELPPIAAVNTTLDVTVSSLADAKSLQGGTLLLTPLKAGDGEVYAVAQGAVTIGGFSVQSRSGEQAQKNHVTVGRVPGGASVVKALDSSLAALDTLELVLLQPDFTTAWRVAQVINQAHGERLATAVDQATVRITLPLQARADITRFVVELENLPVEPDAAARVVINERTGTVVIGSAVRLLPVAICHGGLTVEVHSETQVSQPPPLVGEAAGGAAVVVPGSSGTGGNSLTGGQTVVVRQEDLRVREAPGQLATVPAAATLDDLVKALNTLGVKPRDLIAILQALKEAGALQAELVLL